MIQEGFGSSSCFLWRICGEDSHFCSQFVSAMERAMIRFLLLLLVTTQLTSDADPITNSLQGKHLIVVLENFPPSTVIERDESGHVTGYSGSLVAHFDWLSKRLGFEYTMIPWDNSMDGPIKSNESRNPFAGMIRLLIGHEVDAALGPFVIRLERQDIGIGGIMGTITSELLIPYPNSNEKSIYATVEPFDYEIWIAIILSLLTVSSCSWFILFISARFLNFDGPVQGTAAKLLIYFFKVIVQQGNSYARVTRSIGVLAFTWSLIAIVIVNAYNSSVISHLSANYRKPEVSTFKELAENEYYKMLALKGGVAEVDVVNGVTEALQTIAKKYKNCPDCSMEFNPAKIAEKIIEGKHVAVLPRLQALNIIQQLSPKGSGGECKLTMGNDRLKYYYAFFGVPKDSPYQEDLRKESLWNIAHGFTIHADSMRDVIGTGQCLLKYNSKGVQTESKISPIKLKQLFVPFAMLIGGWILGFLQFLREKMHAHFMRHWIKEQENAAALVPPAIQPPPSVVNKISRPVPTKKSKPPVKRKITANKSKRPLKLKSNRVVTAAPLTESPPVAINISRDHESDSGNEAGELKTVVTVVDIHQQQKKATKSMVQPKIAAPFTKIEPTGIVTDVGKEPDVTSRPYEIK